ncbi:helix-turn-helix domain-containing protein [Desertivirga brevis]|uniref:helix-turn-helix domain-containing protein n=1 Tax=Desertivirga brevis TaxID=2810310 RepID=UPI001F611A5F|nr:helix-turn-helix domain-containing protein [Pedobacter sp. SYSU D00873]
MTQTAFTLINPQTNALAFKIFEFEDDSYFREKRNHNYYSILLVSEGTGSLKADFSEHIFSRNTLMCFSVYQPFMIKADGEFKGILLNFHPDFFCIHKHQKEVACNGVLFNNIYQSPVMQLRPEELSVLLPLINQLKSEMQHPGVAQYELMVSYLKILLINASRLKMAYEAMDVPKTDNEPFILQTLKDAIEEHYRTRRRASDYADLLNISTRALNRISKSHFNKTLTDLIAERVIIEAKRELYLTSKPVKAIANELGFPDEFYFSRYFKSNTQVSPQFYRNTVGFARAEL